MPGSGCLSLCVRGVFLLVLALLCGTNSQGAEVEVKNDSLIDGNSGTPCLCFVSGESSAAWLTSPCDGDLVAVQVFWRSQFGGGPSSTEMAISIFQDGTFPTPGGVLVNQDSSPAIITGPTLSDGALNEFRHLDAAQNIPLGVPVTSGETFVVSLKVLNQCAGNPFTPTFVYDLDRCQANRNAVEVIPGGWSDACLAGVTGDWMIRAVVDCGPERPVQAPPPHDILKNRYISVDPRGAAGSNPSNVHIRVMVDSSQVNGQTGTGPWWATAPQNGAGVSPAVCISVLAIDKPTVAPDWSGCPTVHLTGCPIIPTTTYAIAAEFGGVLSANELLDTQAKPGVKWHGDCVGFFNGTNWTPPNLVTTIDDAVAGIKTFQNPSAFNATHLSVTDVHPNLNGSQINLLVNIGDVFTILLGFQGLEYPGADLTMCDYE